jgi:glycosyltransferase involved in cell wall biosynthesis
MIIHIFNSSVISGPETLVIPSLVQLGNNFKVFLLRETRHEGAKNRSVETYLDSMNVAWTAIDVKGRWDKSAIGKLADELKKADCQIAHAHDVKASTYLLKATAQISNRKFSIVTTHHGISARLTWKLRAYEMFYTFLIATQFDRILAVCTADYRRLIRRGISSDRVRLHLNGVSRPPTEPTTRLVQQQNIRRNWQARLNPLVGSEGTVMLGVVARFAEGKRHGLILQVAARLKKIAPALRFQFLFFGSGPMETQLRAQAMQMGLDNEVLWMGYDPHIGSQMAGLDVLVSLSSAEGLPINLIEAGWAGTPVFATGVDGVLDLIDSPEAGVLLGPEEHASAIAEKLRDFLASPEQLSSTGAFFQERVRRRFSGEAWFARLKEIYSELRPLGQQGVHLAQHHDCEAL